MRFLSFIQRKLLGRHRIYLDFAAATPLDLEVYEAMKPYFMHVWGNPSAIHREGMDAKIAIEKSRREIARVLHIRATDIIFTGSGTESNNLAIAGLIRHIYETGSPYTDTEVISTPLEHPSIGKVLQYFEGLGVRVHTCNVDNEGLIDIEHLRVLLSRKTALVTFAYVNSEIGAVQDVRKVTRVIKKFNNDQKANIKVHLDASQAPLWLPCAMDVLGVDLLTLDAHKCYGPKGVGVLAHVHGVALEGVTLGGDQEGGNRAGTENTPLIVGCALAIKKAQKDWRSRSEAVASLRDHMIDKLEKTIEGAVLNGPRKKRVANNVNISISDIDSEFAVVVLDAHGIAASTKSACSGAEGGGSRVVQAITHDNARADSTIRFTLGEKTTKKELERSVDALLAHVLKTRLSKESLGPDT